MQFHILDGGQAMCSNGDDHLEALSSTSSSSNTKHKFMGGQVKGSEQQRQSGGGSSSSSTSTSGKGVASTLTALMAPSSSNNTSQRSTSIPNPAGGGAATQTNKQDSIDNAEQGNSSRRPSMPFSSRRQPSSSTLTALLEPFNPSSPTADHHHQHHQDAANGRIKIPSTSRAGADIAEQKTANGVGILESWKYLPFLAHQASKLATAFVSHHVFGPPKKSWGIELTLFTTAIRESVQYSHLSSLPTLRRFLNLGQILPVPKDGVVTPITFQIFKRNLPGILAEFDDKEDGTRELTGEWVVSKRIWRRMQRDHYGSSSTGGIPSSSSRSGGAASSPGRKSSASSSAASRTRNNANDSHPTASSKPPSSTSSSPPRPSQPRHTSSSSRSSHYPSSSTGRDKVILYLHGGAYYTMSAATHRYITISVSKYTNCRVFAVNYRLAPECRWPGQIHDAVQSYLRLIQDLKIPSEMIIIMGDSAGGGLTLATIMYLRDHGFPLPCGAIVMSPWVDLTMSCDSWETNAPYDYLRMPSGDDHMNPIASLLGASNVKKLITHPYVSPLFGNFKDFPPLLIQCGDAECLRDEGTLLAHKASLAGVQVYHEVYEDCPHVFQAMFFLEASKKAFRSHRNFVRKILPSLYYSSTTTTSNTMTTSINKDAAATASSSSDFTTSSSSHTGLSGEAADDVNNTDRRSKREMRVDLSEMDQEVMSDAHNIKADGEAEVAPLPASPRGLRRELSSLTPLHVDTATGTTLDPGQNRELSTSKKGSKEIVELDPATEFLEEDGDLGYDDEEDEDEEGEESNPFNVESSGASTSEMDDDNELEQPPSPSKDDSEILEDGQHNPASADLALNATAGMVKLGTKLTTSTHHDLDSVAEEQDESIDNMESDETSNTHDKTSSSSFSLPRNISSHRLHANYAHQHQHNARSISASTTPSHSPSASFTSLPHSSPSGSHTPLASRTPTSSAPPSPGTSIRNSNRQRSFSSLSMASLTPSNNNNSLKRHNSSQGHGSSNIAISTTASPRPGHSRSNSSLSTRTMRPGQFREMSKPRARANSHPDLQALLDSYDAAGPAQRTILWRNDEDNSPQLEAEESSGHHRIAERRLSSDDDSMDYDAFDT